MGKPRGSSLEHLVAGSVAGAVSRTACAPLDRVKILLQVQAQHAAGPQGVLATLYSIARREGVLGFFRGNGTNMVRMVPYSAVQFASYEQFKRLLAFDRPEPSTAGRLAAGAAAGITSILATYPLDLVRTRMATQSAVAGVPQYRGIVHCLTSIVRDEGGIRSGALYRGMSPTLLAIAPYVGLNFAIYESLKTWCLARGWTVRGRDSLSVPVRLCCGAAAATCSQTLLYPLDLVRRRMQVSGVLGAEFAYPSTWAAIRTISRREGVRALYRGILPSYLKVVPSVSISFVVYEACKDLLRKTDSAAWRKRLESLP